MPTPYNQYTNQTDVSAPASSGAPAPAYDGAPFANGPCRAIYVGTGGIVVGRSKWDTADVTFKNVANGQIIDYRFNSFAAGTTASDIVLLY